MEKIIFLNTGLSRDWMAFAKGRA